MAVYKHYPKASISVLAANPRKSNNSCAVRQSAIISFSGYQYAAFYTSDDLATNAPRFVTLARRRIKRSLEDVGPAKWKLITFRDYSQRTPNDSDDENEAMTRGCGTISMGICPADGTIHLAFDNNCDQLKYRCSTKGLASNEKDSAWSVNAFSPIQGCLLGRSNQPLDGVMFPKFVAIGYTLLFECQMRKGEESSNVLYSYDSSTRSFSFVRAYLIGDQQCTPSTNNVCFQPNTKNIHVTWTNQHLPCVKYNDVYTDHDNDNYDSNSDTECSSSISIWMTSPSSSVSSLPSSAHNEVGNNEGLYHAMSDDGGHTWRSTSFAVSTIATETSTGLSSRDVRLRARHIPRGSGVMNSEGQAVDSSGVVHVLNRQVDATSGKMTWMHYWSRSSTTGNFTEYDVDNWAGDWAASAIPFADPTPLGPRGTVVWHSASDSLFFLLPANHHTTQDLVILRGRRTSNGAADSKCYQLEVVWSGAGFAGEPSLDQGALDESDMLSVFTLQRAEKGEKKIVVIDIAVDDICRDRLRG